MLNNFITYLCGKEFFKKIFIKFLPNTNDLLSLSDDIMKELNFTQYTKHCDNDQFFLSSQKIFVSLSLIVVAVKLSETDSPINDKEINFITKILNISSLEKWKLLKLISDAKKDQASYETFLKQFKRVYKYNETLYSDLLDMFFNLARSDGDINSQEVVFLRKISNALDLGDEQFKLILRYHTISDYKDPYKTLGIPKDTNLRNLEKAYKNYIKTCHPDKFGFNLDKDLSDIMNEKFMRGKEAYNYIKNRVSKKKISESA